MKEDPKRPSFILYILTRSYSTLISEPIYCTKGQ